MSQPVSGFSAWVAATRPKTLAAAFAPIVVGAAEAYRIGQFDWYPLVICLGFALLVQIATNMANDYFDYIKGADTEERVGPERMVASGKIAPRSMLVAAIAIFAVAFVLGFTLVAYRGWELLIVGILSILFGYCYTGGPYPLAYHGLGDIFVVVFFGIVATSGTFYVMTGDVRLEIALVGVALGLLANNILVANNYRDMETDARARKRTLIVVYGRAFGAYQFLFQSFAVYALVAVYGYMTANRFALAACVFAPLSYRLCRKLPRLKGEALNGILSGSAKVLLLFGIVLALGMAAQRWAIEW